MTTRHIGYVDQRTRQNAHTYLNHEQWHRRRTLISWNSSSEISSGASTASVLSSAASTAALNATHYTASNTTTLRVANLGNLLHTTEALATVSSADWDNQTDAACSSSLSSLNGIPSNPSGTSACYNIRSLDNSTGAFEVDLRLYRVAAPTGDWSQLGGLDFSLDLLFYGATVQASSTRKSKRGVVRITLPSVQKYDARGLYRMRLNDATPKTLNRSRFWGKTDQAFEVEIMNE